MKFSHADRDREHATHLLALATSKVADRKNAEAIAYTLMGLVVLSHNPDDVEAAHKLIVESSQGGVSNGDES